MALKKKWKIGLFITSIFVLIIYLFFAGDYNLYHLWKLKQKRKALISEIANQKKKNLDLQTEIQKLKADSTHIEKIAREKYTMGKKGETIYKFNQKAQK